MRIKRFGKLALAAALIGACPLASAAEPGFYVGGFYGKADKDVDLEPFIAIADFVYDELLLYVPNSGTFGSSSEDGSYGFLGGYRLTQHIAFEAGWMYLGKENYRESTEGTSGTEAESWDLSLTRKTSGFAISALGVLPISYLWEVYARGGVLFTSNSVSLFVAGPARGATEFSDSSTDLLAGAGISVSLAEVYSLRAEFTRIFDAGTEDFGEEDVDLISLGVTVAF